MQTFTHLVLVGAHAGEDDVIFLPALEGVHAGALDLGIQRLAQRAAAAGVAIRGVRSEEVGEAPQVGMGREGCGPKRHNQWQRR